MESQKTKTTDKKDTCAICGHKIEGNKYNPWPYDDDPGRPYCCEECYEKHVIPDAKSLSKFLGKY